MARPATSGVKPAQRLDPDMHRRAPADGNAALTQASLAAGVLEEEDLEATPAGSSRTEPARTESPRTESPRTESPRKASGPQDTREEAPREEPPRMVHVLQRGQTLFSVAKRYGVDVDDLARTNGIANPHKVAAGTRLIVPGKAPGKARGKQAVVRGPLMVWPLRGLVTARYGRRGKSGHHTGLDIDGDRGDPILAAASGTVVRAGSDGRYGQVVILDHGKGLTTLYAHASRLLVEEGEQVRMGDAIAEVGGSGNARGTHLHFEVRRDDQPIDPMPFLRETTVLTAGVQGNQEAR